MQLTMKERKRIELVQHVLAGKVATWEAARVADRTERTLYRWCAALAAKGLAGLVHGNKGRPSSRRISASVRKRVLALAQRRYADVNDTHLAELLAEREHIVIGRETLRGLLRSSGLPPKRKRRRPKYRSRRERREAFGMMLQIDASPHAWLEDRGPRLTLVGAKDDATSHVWARFVESETTWAYLDLMRQVFSSHGLPLSLYSDRHSIFHTQREPTIVEQLKDIQPLTQFGRAMDELGIRILKAWTPQAKGRIERQWGVFQDRLVVELRLAKAKNRVEANALLDRFLVAYNQRFTIPARNATPVFHPAPAASVLDHILCIKETRKVGNDHTVSVDGLTLQIPPAKFFRTIAGRRVDVLQLHDRSLTVRYRDRVVARFSSQAVERLLRSLPSPPSSLRIVA